MDIERLSGEKTMLKSITLLLALAATTVQATELPTIKAY